MKAVILAAGSGTRFHPLTKSVPKELLPIINLPAIQYVVNELADSGIDDITIVTSKGKNAICDYFDSQGIDMNYVRQQVPLGTGHALLSAKRHIGSENFCLLLGDDIITSKIPCTEQMITQYNKTYSTILSVEKLPLEEMKKYGAVTGNLCDTRLYEVQDLIEKPKTPVSNLALVGRYILTQEIFTAIEQTKPGYNNEIHITDSLKIVLKEQPVYAYQFDGKRFDVGTPSGWLKCILSFVKNSSEYRPILDDFIQKELSSSS